jgi:hypothetical protein
MSNEKLSNEATNPPLRKGVVSGSPLFKKQLVEYLIPRIEAMAEIERVHLHCLIDMGVPSGFINMSQETHLHLVGKIKEYKEYAERL